MVQLTDEVIDQINRILAGRPPNPNKATLNQAINYINEHPHLRRIAEGGAPAGLSPEQRRAYGERQLELSRLSPREQERLRALQGLAREREFQRIVEEKQQAEQKKVVVERTARDKIFGGRERDQTTASSVLMDRLVTHSVRVERPRGNFVQRAFAREGFEKESGVLKKVKEDYIPKLGEIGVLGIGDGKTGKFSAEVIAEFVPSTPKGLIFTAGVPLVLTVSPPAVTYLASGYFAYTGVKGALDPSLTPQQRVASGVIATGGVIGVTQFTTPFIKGGLAKFSKTYRPIVKQTIKVGEVTGEAKFIENVPKVDKIALIPEKIGSPQIKGAGAGEGASIRGGFGFKPKEQVKAFFGKTLRLTTSQANIKIVKKVIKDKPEVSDYGFFFTPADPVTNIPQTRVSRLGAIDLFKFPKIYDAKFSFLDLSQPKILVSKPTKVGGVVKVAPKRTTELEVTAKTDLVITEKLGKTTLKGQRVDIYEFELKKGDLGRKTGTKVGDIPSVKNPTISSSPVITSSLKVSQVKYTVSPPSYKGTSLTSPTSRKNYPKYTPTNYVPRINIPRITTYYSQVRRTGYGTPRYTSIPRVPITPSRPQEEPPKRQREKQPKIKFTYPQDKFAVAVRRRGKFKVIAQNLNLEKATEVGRTKVSRTLSATFKIIPQTKTASKVKTPKGFYRKEGNIFIEKKRFRLSRTPEVKEIQMARKRRVKK